MEIQFNPSVAEITSAILPPPVEKSIDQSRYQSTIISGGVKHNFNSILRSVKNVLSKIFRLSTYPFQLLFAKTPQFNAFVVPDLTPAKKKEYEKLLNKMSGTWGFPHIMRSGPSSEQKIQLLHQFCSFLDHLQQWDNIKTKNGIADGMVIIHRGLIRSTIWLSDNDLKNLEKDAWIKNFLEKISDPKDYVGKETVFSTEFISQCCIDPGYGPYRAIESTLMLKNTLGPKGKISVETEKKDIKTQIHFSSPM